MTAVIVAVQAELDKVPSTSPQGILLMDCLAELFVILLSNLNNIWTLV